MESINPARTTTFFTENAWTKEHKSRVFDGLVQDFLAGNSRAVVLNLGRDANARRTRLGIEPLSWIDADLTQRDARRETISQVLRLVGDRPCMVLAEKTLIFMPHDEVMETLTALEERLPPGSELVFDYVHPWTRWISQVAWTTRSARWIVASLPRFELLSEDLMSRQYQGSRRIFDRAVKRVLGGFSHHDIAHLRVSRGGTA